MNAYSGNFGKSALCRAFGINRSSIYYKRNGQKKLAKIARHEKDLQDVKTAFEEGKGNYGARQIKTALAGKGSIMSRRKIRRLMEESGLESSYGKPKYVKPGKKKADCNKADISNLLGRDFSGWNEKEVLVSDLTYVKVDGKWCYICVIIDLFNREVVGWSIGENKTAELVLLAFAMAGIDFRRVMIFHTDRGMEFCAERIDLFLNRFGIIRSLSRPGTPIDNAVAESFYGTVKTEFVKNQNFPSLERLKLLFGDWVHWYNNIRFHSADGSKSPVVYRREFNNEPLKNIA